MNTYLYEVVNLDCKMSSWGSLHGGKISWSTKITTHLHQEPMPKMRVDLHPHIIEA
jgi:hypothetical protein